MYDGIKIECNVSDKRKWNDSLELVGRHAEKSGEILPLPSECQYNACSFQKIPGHPTKYIFQGSLHKFWNKGGDNDNDYTIKDVEATIQNLQYKFGINPSRSKVINFEFGVNIILPPGISAADYQKYLVSAEQKKGFNSLNTKRPQVGYIAEFAEYSIKVYDKGKQCNTEERNKLRFELKVTRTRWLDQYKFNKGSELLLTDLLKKGNIAILRDILLEKISSLILTPRKVELSKLSPKQRLTFFECRDARSWEEWNSKQRERKREQLSAIFKKLGQDDPVDVLRKLVLQKWDKLTITEEERARQKSRQKDAFSTIIVAGICDLFKFILKSHKYEKGITIRGYVIYKPRGQTLHANSPPLTLTGVKRWIDLRCRSPPDLNHDVT